MLGEILDLFLLLKRIFFCLQETLSAATTGRKTGLECERNEKGDPEAEISPPKEMG